MNRWDMELADTREDARLRRTNVKDRPKQTYGKRRCVYCGAHAYGVTCWAHKDLPALDVR